MQGIFGSMFDFDGNGDLDIFEQAAELCFLDELDEEELKRTEFEDFDDLDDSEYDDF